MPASSPAPSTPDLSSSPSNLPGQPGQPEPPGLQEQAERNQHASFSTCVLPPTFTIVLNYRNGTPRTSCRQLKNLPPTAPWAFDRHRDTYRVLLARVEEYVQGLQGLAFPVDWRPHLQPSNNTYQKNYVELSKENYKHEMEATWRREARRLNSITGVGVTLQLYVYLQSAADATAATNNTLRQVTAARIQAADPPVPATAETIVPDTNTHQQTHHLDQERQQYDERRQARAGERQDIMRTILIEISGVEVPIKVNVGSLRRALNLPRFDPYGMHNFLTRPLRRAQGEMEHLDDG